MATPYMIGQTLDRINVPTTKEEIKAGLLVAAVFSAVVGGAAYCFGDEIKEMTALEKNANIEHSQETSVPTISPEAK